MSWLCPWACVESSVQDSARWRLKYWKVYCSLLFCKLHHLSQLKANPKMILPWTTEPFSKKRHPCSSWGLFWTRLGKQLPNWNWHNTSCMWKWYFLLQLCTFEEICSQTTRTWRKMDPKRILLYKNRGFSTLAPGYLFGIFYVAKCLILGQKSVTEILKHLEIKLNFILLFSTVLKRCKPTLECCYLSSSGECVHCLSVIFSWIHYELV